MAASDADLLTFLRMVLVVRCPTCKRHLGQFRRNQQTEALAAAREHICDVTGQL